MKKDNSNYYNSSGKNFLEAIKPRNTYKVYKSNILAQTQGNLLEIEKSIMDYCLTFVKATDVYDSEKTYKTSIKEIVETIGSKSSGGSSSDYIGKKLLRLKAKANILIPLTKEKNGSIVRGYNIVNIFNNLEFWEDGSIEFSFHEKLAPFIYQLTDGNFYSEELSKLQSLRSKYARNIYEIYMSKRYGNNRVTVVNGSLDEWYLWALGSEIVEDEKKISKWTAGKFKDKILNVAKKKIEEVFSVIVDITPEKKGRRVVAFSIRFTLINSREILAINDLLNRKKEQSELEKKYETEYMERITDNAIKNNYTMLESASELVAKKIIKFIPSKLLPQKFQKKQD